MYAIFEAKGKQWRAEEGATLRLPSLDAEPGDRVVFDRVLLAQRGEEVLVGRPALRNAAVAVEVAEHGKGEKIIVFKRKRRKKYRRKYGHRQPYTEVTVVEIDLEEATAPAPGEAPDAEAAPEEEAIPEAAEPEAAEEEPPEAEEVDATDAAAALAEDHGIDLASLEGTGKEGRVLKSDVQAAVEAAEAAREAAEADEAAPEEAEEPEEEEDAGGAVIPEEVDITGAAEELAEEHGVDVTRIEGTGKDGRVLKSDVQEAIEEQGGE